MSGLVLFSHAMSGQAFRVKAACVSVCQVVISFVTPCQFVPCHAKCFKPVSCPAGFCLATPCRAFWAMIIRARSCLVALRPVELGRAKSSIISRVKSVWGMLRLVGFCQVKYRVTSRVSVWTSQIMPCPATVSRFKHFKPCQVTPRLVRLRRAKSGRAMPIIKKSEVTE